jgi:Zn-dependent alcohol dehydrogenase
VACIRVDTTSDALKLALHCGADHAVVADGQQAQQVRDLTGSGADAAFDFVGEDATIAETAGSAAAPSSPRPDAGSAIGLPGLR